MTGKVGSLVIALKQNFVRGTWLLSPKDGKYLSNYFLPVLSFFRSNKQQEKEKKFQRIQTEHIKSEC